MQIAGQKFFNYIEILIFVKFVNMKGFIPKKKCHSIFFFFYIFFIIKTPLFLGVHGAGSDTPGQYKF